MSKEKQREVLLEARRIADKMVVKPEPYNMKITKNKKNNITKKISEMNPGDCFIGNNGLMYMVAKNHILISRKESDNHQMVQLTNEDLSMVVDIERGQIWLMPSNCEREVLSAQLVVQK